jgi:putative ABC transport system substrate-binding protein
VHEEMIEAIRGDLRGGLKRPDTAKRVELLHELLPGARRIAVLVNPTNPAIAQNVIEELQVAERRLGLEIVVLKAATEGDIESSVATAAQAGRRT